MIILNDYAINPVYTRITRYRMYIFAEIAVNANQIPDRITPGTEIIDQNVGILYIDTAITQGNTMIIRAYDPLAFVAKHTVCDHMNGNNVWSDTGRITRLVYNLINAQATKDVLPRHNIEMWEPTAESTKEVKITVRNDMLFDVYTQMPDQYDPQLRMNITHGGGLDGKTVYQPESTADPESIAISADYAVDYANLQTTPTQAVVCAGAGRFRDITPVPQDVTNPLQIYVNARAGETALIAGNTALTSAAAQAESTTIRVLTADLPADISPGDILINMPSAVLPASNTARVINAIEYASSSRGDIAYVMCGGKILGVADRINAIIAADYTARY